MPAPFHNRDFDRDLDRNDYSDEHRNLDRNEHRNLDRYKHGGNDSDYDSGDDPEHNRGDDRHHHRHHHRHLGSLRPVQLHARRDLGGRRDTAALRLHGKPPERSCAGMRQSTY